MSLLSSSPFRLAFIGCGKRAQEHMVGVLADSRVQIVALADAFEQATVAFKEKNQLDVPLYTNHREMLERERPDVVIAALWTHLHLPVYRDCVAAGVRAVLSEKPMAARWDECLEMAQLAEMSGCLLTFCHQRRFAGGNQRVRQWLAEGRFGKIQRMDLFSPMHLLDCGTHSVDQALSFNDETPVSWVHGAVDISDTINWFNVQAEIMATGILYFENGVHATLRVGTQNMDMWGGVRVHGEDGFIEAFWDGELRRAVVYNDPAWTPPPLTPEPGEQMIGVVRNAIDCLISGDEPELSHRKALRASEVLFALYESARRHSRITLPLTEVAGNPLHEMLAARGMEQL